MFLYGSTEIASTSCSGEVVTDKYVCHFLDPLWVCCPRAPIVCSCVCIVSRFVAKLASRSTSSLPKIPTWLGVQ